jgi:hypothetical protein
MKKLVNLFRKPVKKSQSERLLCYLKQYKQIDRLQAVYGLGIFELARCIRDLEKKGYKFHKIPKTVKNKFGDKIHCKDYILD